MDRNISHQVLANESEATEPQPESDCEQQAAGIARKLYAPPRLIQHGRLTTLTSAQGSPGIPSDRNVKEGFEPIEARAILARVLGLPIECWSYKGEPVRHLGPMAQDFTA